MRAQVLPMLRSDGWIALPASLRGRKLRAVVDTGAFPEFTLPFAEAKKLRLITGREKNLYPSGARACMVRKPVRLRVGRRAYTATSVLAWDSTHLRAPDKGAFDHLLGLQFLLKHVTEFDFARKRVVFHPLDSKPPFPYTRAQLIPFTQVREDLLLIRARLNGRWGWFMWDTGATNLFLTREALQRCYPKLARRLHWSKAEPSNVHGKMRQAPEFRLGSIELGGMDYARRGKPAVLRKVMACGHDAPHDHRSLELSAGHPLLGVLDASLQGARRILLDPRRGFIWRFGGR